MRWHEIQQIFIDANESATFISRAVYKVFCFWVHDQRDAQYFYMYVFQFSTCFEQPRAHHQKRSPTQRVVYWYNWFSWWWTRGCSKHIENWNKYIEKNCKSSWAFTKNHNKMYSQQNIKGFMRRRRRQQDPPTWRHVPEDGNLHHHCHDNLRSYTIQRFRNNSHTIFSFPEHPNQQWGPNSLLFNRNRGHFFRRSGNQKREAGHSPPPSIVLPSPTCHHTCTWTT
jgi:hypothetical protein